MGIIISGFSNIGKSHISRNKNISCFDLDTTYFKKLPDTNWEEVYVECARGLSQIYDYVFITTYTKPLEIMNEKGIKYYLIYPERNLKEEYKKRAISRGSNKDFTEGFFSRWDKHIDDCERNTCPNKIILKSNEYLSDILDRIK
jgi:hypothetical protein